MKVDVGDVFIPKMTAFCQDCLWVDRPALTPTYTAVLRRAKGHVSKTGHEVVLDRLFRSTIKPRR